MRDSGSSCTSALTSRTRSVKRSAATSSYPSKMYRRGSRCALDSSCPQHFIGRVLLDQRRKILGICCKWQEYRDEPPCCSEFDGLSGYDGFSGTRLAEHNGEAAVEDVVEMGSLVVAGTGAQFERRPAVPLLCGFETARKPEGQRPSLLDITDITIEIVTSHR